MGILKQMHDEMTKDLADLAGEEKGQAADYESLVAAKVSDFLFILYAPDSRVGDPPLIPKT